MKRLIMDLDDTLTLTDASKSYSKKRPNIEVVEKLREYKQAGFEIVIQTARNVRTYNGNVGKINANTLPVIIDWLRKHDIPFDEIYVGKPWCGTEGFYVDDKAIRPDEFLKYSSEEIRKLLKIDN
ncbi:MULTISPECIES: HAD family hydrolase [Acetobacter]|uniref:Phosphatase IIIC n=2 Tax=Acetobacter TaxID=434 RepID=A0A401WUR9_ACEPA|nr:MULTISPECIES: capsular biosynthesis protein [Acetobacter]AOW46587.1 capsular biosynthesis protein [Acetobacter ascendens]GCD53091.1 phosphatase IIIC [Acetobacter pasteurianus NBRC 3188]